MIVPYHKWHFMAINQSPDLLSLRPLGHVTTKNKTSDKLSRQKQRKIVDVLTLKDLPDSFGEHFLPYKTTLRQRIQARRFANESYLNCVKLFGGDNGEIRVKSEVFHSQRKSDPCHKIAMSVRTDTILDAFCSCKSGTSGECAHVLAVILKLTDWILEGLQDIPSQPACTSMPQQWDRPRGNKILPEPVSTMVISKQGNTTRKKRPLTADFSDNRKIQLLDTDIEFLQTLESTPISYLAYQPYKSTVTEHGLQNVSSALAYQMALIHPVEEPSNRVSCGNLEFPLQPDISNMNQVQECVEKLKNVAVTQDEAIQMEKMEKNTRDQSNDDAWFVERKKKITASNLADS